MPDKESRSIDYIKLDEDHLLEVYPTVDRGKKRWAGVIRKRGARVGSVNMCQSQSDLLVQTKEILAVGARQRVDYELLTKVLRRSGEARRYTFTLYDADIQNIEKLSERFGEEGNRSLAIRYAVAKVARDMGL